MPIPKYLINIIWSYLQHRIIVIDWEMILDNGSGVSQRSHSGAHSVEYPFRWRSAVEGCCGRYGDSLRR